MAQVAALPGLDSLAGIGAEAQALAKLESLGEDPNAAQARRKSAGLLRRAIKAWRRGDVVRAGQLALRATEADATDGQAFHILAMALEKMGHTHKALVTYEHAYQLNPTDPDLALNLGLTAWAMKMNDVAAELFRQYIDRCPDSPLGYNNLGSIQSDMGDPETAVDTLRGAIYRMPDQAILWNSLATVLAEQGRSEESLIFYQEAIKLDPGFSRPWHNLGYAYMHLGRMAEALEAYDEALARAIDVVDKREGRHARSACLIGMGQLEEGFREYEIRNDPTFRTYIHHITKAPVWKGEPLAGKRILIAGEQGLGDEIMFANILPDLAKAVGPEGKLQIAVDPRLVPLFRRSFPGTEIGAYDDRQLVEPDGVKELRFIPWAAENREPDFFAPMGTPLQFLRKRIEDFPRQTTLIADPKRVAEFRARLEALGPGPYVGICWRSMMMDVKRQKYFTALDAWSPVLKTQGVKFINVQYGDCKNDLSRFATKYGVEVTAFGDLDLKQDIEGAAALSAALDLVISAPTAAAAIAAGVGTETWFLTAGRTWPQLGADHYPWYRAAPVFSPENFGDWQALMPKVSAELARYSKKARAA